MKIAVGELTSHDLATAGAGGGGGRRLSFPKPSPEKWTHNLRANEQHHALCSLLISCRYLQWTATVREGPQHTHGAVSHRRRPACQACSVEFWLFILPIALVTTVLVFRHQHHVEDDQAVSAAARRPKRDLRAEPEINLDQPAAGSHTHRNFGQQIYQGIY